MSNAYYIIDNEFKEFPPRESSINLKVGDMRIVYYSHDDYWIRVVVTTWSATTCFTWRLPTEEEEALVKTHLLIQGL